MIIYIYNYIKATLDTFEPLRVKSLAQGSNSAKLVVVKLYHVMILYVLNDGDFNHHIFTAFTHKYW